MFIKYIRILNNQFFIMNEQNTLIIFDWDDTLFPTYWLISTGINMRSLDDIRKYLVYFKELDTIVSKLLYEALRLGKVIIVTNASIDWIRL